MDHQHCRQLPPPTIHTLKSPPSIAFLCCKRISSSQSCPLDFGGQLAPTMLSLTVRICVLTFLLLLLHHVLMFQRQVEVEARLRQQRNWSQPLGRGALVTMADPIFQHCAVELLRSARAHEWDHPIVLLAIDYDQFEPLVIKELDALGVVIIHTHPVFDEWLNRGVENIDFFRELQPSKFRKMELFFNPVLRAYERLIFIDADGVVDASLEPLMYVPFPENTSLLMRQNDVSVGKNAFWGNEMAVEVLTDRQLALLSKNFPNRVKTGGSCWFLVDVRKLHSPVQILARSLELLCTFRAGFRFNDQTLISLLFYDAISLFPWCVWDEVRVLDHPWELTNYCSKNQHLQRWLNGKLKFMYRHMSVKEKEQCAASRPVDAGPAESVQRNEELGYGREGGNVDSRFLEEEVDSKICMDALRQWRTRLPTE